MTSQILIKKIQRCFPSVDKVTIKEVFIPKYGWVNASAGTPYFTIDSLEYLKSKGGKMVQLEVTENEGKISNPDYNIDALLRK